MHWLKTKNPFAFGGVDQGVGEDENCNDPNGCVEFVSHLFPNPLNVEIRLDDGVPAQRPAIHKQFIIFDSYFASVTFRLDDKYRALSANHEMIYIAVSRRDVVHNNEPIHRQLLKNLAYCPLCLCST